MAGLPSSTTSLKIAMIILGVLLIVHAAGFATTSWATLHILGGLASYHSGLWQHCGCFNLFGSEICSCTGRSGDPGWFKVVQAMEAVGLVGLLISGIMSLILVCSRQDKTLRGINLCTVIGSGICILIGVILFGVENTKAFEDIFGALDDANVESHGDLSFSFVLCAVAGGICLLVCAPLFVVDMRTPTPPASQQLPVQYSNQGQVIMPHQGPAQVVVNTGRQQHVGYMPTKAGYYAPHGQPVPYGVQYPQHSGQPVQYGEQYPQHSGGIPYKAY